MSGFTSGQVVTMYISTFIEIKNIYSKNTVSSAHTMVYMETLRQSDTNKHTHTLDKKWIIRVTRWELNPITCN